MHWSTTYILLAPSNVILFITAALLAWLSIGLLLFSVLATSEVISGWIPSCDSAHSWWLYSAASLGHQATGTMTCYLTLSWHWANQSLPYPNNAKHYAKKGQVSLVWLDQGSNLKGPDSKPRDSDSWIFQHERRTVYSFGHTVCVYYMDIYVILIGVIEPMLFCCCCWRFILPIKDKSE